MEIGMINNLNHFLNQNKQIEDIDLTNNFSSDIQSVNFLTENSLNIQNVFSNTNEYTNPDDIRDDDVYYLKNGIKKDVIKKDECKKRRFKERRKSIISER